MSATFITRLSAPGSGIRVGVKDLLDMAGEITTAGSRAVEAVAVPAAADAACLAGTRRAGARIVGKTNLHELAYGADGINPSYGTPVNPLDPERCPGGSSSGSAVAVATGEADVTYGSDTGGSIRIPSACCGTVGLKTTWGRIPTGGCWPLAPSLDTIGPMAASVAGVVTGMDLLEPGFAAEAAATAAPRVIGRVRAPGGWAANERIDAAIDAALAAAGFEVVEVDVPGWNAARDAGIVVLSAEAWASDRHLLEDREPLLTPGMADRLRSGATITADQLARARAAQGPWQAELAALFTRVELLALPTLPDFAPPLSGAANVALTTYTRPANFSGTPAISVPVPVPGFHLPASLQLMGPAAGEAALCRAAAQVEAAVES